MSVVASNNSNIAFLLKYFMEIRFAHRPHSASVPCLVNQRLNDPCKNSGIQIEAIFRHPPPPLLHPPTSQTSIPIWSCHFPTPSMCWTRPYFQTYPVNSPQNRSYFWLRYIGRDSIIKVHIPMFRRETNRATSKCHETQTNAFIWNFNLFAINYYKK